jgi:hypothetical protein
MNALAALIITLTLFPQTTPGRHIITGTIDNAAVVFVVEVEATHAGACWAFDGTYGCATNSTQYVTPQISVDYAPAAPDRCRALPITLHQSIDGVAQPAQELGSIAPATFCAYLPEVSR